MNLWECNHPGCTETTVGCGGAIGLRAIGWYFLPGDGSEPYCPAHRPDPIPCLEPYENKGNPCSLCAAEQEARKFQVVLYAMLGLELAPARLRGLVQLAGHGDNSGGRS